MDWLMDDLCWTEKNPSMWVYLVCDHDVCLPTYKADIHICVDTGSMYSTHAAVVNDNINMYLYDQICRALYMVEYFTRKYKLDCNKVSP